jgi:hypothetical protein
MPYRDDRDALRARSDDLERDVATLRAQLALRQTSPARTSLARRRVPLLLAAGLVVAAAQARAPTAGASFAPMAIPHALDTTATAPPSAVSPSNRQHIFRARIDGASGPAPLGTGELCTIKVTQPARAATLDPPCQLSLRCPTRGDDGVARSRCSFDDDGLPHVVTPWLRLLGRHVEYSTGEGTSRYTLSLAIE